MYNVTVREGVGRGVIPYRRANRQYILYIPIYIYIYIRINIYSPLPQLGLTRRVNPVTDACDVTRSGSPLTRRKRPLQDLADLVEQLVKGLRCVGEDGERTLGLTLEKTRLS